MVVAALLLSSGDTLANTVENQLCNSDGTPMKATSMFQCCCLKFPYHCCMHTIEAILCT